MAVSRTLLVLTLLFLILTSQLFAKSGLPPALELLLSGQSADYYAVASSLDESDLPTALAVIRLLKFKSAHREIRLSVRDIKSFRNSIRARIESSETISFKKNEVCITKVSARTIAYESREVRVPPFFVASLFFRIVTVSPRGEAGTVLPDLAVRFKCAKLPVKAKMAIDGKRVRGLVIRDESVFYRPKPEAKNMLSIGKHKAAVLLMDADGRKRKKVWYFTVGEESVPAQNIPQGSVAVGQVSMPLSFFHLGKSVSGSVIVKVYEDGRGNRKLKYFLLKSGSSKSLLSTTSLKGFRRITAKEFDYGKVTTAPTTPFAFDTNEFTLKYEYIGPGNVLKTSWEIEGGPDGSDPIFSSDKKVPWELKEYVSARLHLVVRFPAEDDESEPFEVDFDETVSISSFKIDTEIFEEYDLAVTQTGTGSIELDGTRELWNYTTDESSKLIEGESIPILNKGKLIVNKKHAGKFIIVIRVQKFKMQKKN